MEALIRPERRLITPDEFAALPMRDQQMLRYGVRGAAEPHCFGSLQVCRTRIARLDANGSPSSGSTNGYVTNALIEATVDPDVEEGAKLVLKNGCGDICQTFRDCDRLTGLTIELMLCHLDSILISYLTGGSNIADLAGVGLGNSIGFELPGTDDACPNGVSLELWSKAWDANTQATPPFLGGTTLAYFHWVFPKTRWQIGQLKFENDFMRINVKGYAEENPRITTNGPFDDWPADVATRGGITNLGGWFMDSAIPAASCGAVNVPSAAS